MCVTYVTKPSGDRLYGAVFNLSLWRVQRITTTHHRRALPRPGQRSILGRWVRPRNPQAADAGWRLVRKTCNRSQTMEEVIIIFFYQALRDRTYYNTDYTVPQYYNSNSRANNLTKFHFFCQPKPTVTFKFDYLSKFEPKTVKYCSRFCGR
jgi:hypothetical protein